MSIVFASQACNVVMSILRHGRILHDFMKKARIIVLTNFLFLRHTNLIGYYYWLVLAYMLCVFI